MRQPVLITVLILAFAPGLPAADGKRAYWERVTIDGGSELLTLFSVLPGDVAGDDNSEIPILSILRDTLGDADPANDRLRYVWLLVDEKHGTLTRWLTPEPNFGDMPRPIVDLSAPGKRVWKAVVRSVVETMLLDPSGARIRIPSRTYLSDQRASRTVRLFEALTVMLHLDADAPAGALAPQEYSQVLGRLILAERTFGGLVRDTRLEHILRRELGARRQALGRNWELLRQRAEAEGLLFQPIGLDGELAVAAMVWISRADLDSARRRPFRSKHLGISDPWRDRALHQRSGFAETWHFDSEGRRVADAAASVRSEEVLPLTLHGLDHPKAPFLLIDFRSPWKPRFREAVRRTLEEVPQTVLGWTSFTNVKLRGALLAWNSIRGRQGAPVRRAPRLRAAVAVRQVVSSSYQLEPQIREYVAARLGAAGPSSSRRYEPLLAWARSPEGLAQRIEKDRGRELAKLLHPTRTRWLNVVTIATAGLYRYRVPPSSSDHLALLRRERRLANAARVLEAALAVSPRVDVGTDVGRIRAAAYDLATIPSVNPPMQERAARLLVRVAEQAGGDGTRRELLDLLDDPEEAGAKSALVEAGGTD